MRKEVKKSKKFTEKVKNKNGFKKISRVKKAIKEIENGETFTFENFEDFEKSLEI